MAVIFLNPLDYCLFRKHAVAQNMQVLPVFKALPVLSALPVN